MSDATMTALLLRLPTRLKVWLRDRATENDRTMTGEIKAILKSVQDRDAPDHEAR